MTELPLVSQCAETQSIARGRSRTLPISSHAVLNAFVSIAFMGLPCPTKSTGILVLPSLSIVTPADGDLRSTRRYDQVRYVARGRNSRWNAFFCRPSSAGLPPADEDTRGRVSRGFALLSEHSEGIGRRPQRACWGSGGSSSSGDDERYAPVCVSRRQAGDRLLLLHKPVADPGLCENQTRVGRILLDFLS